MGTSGAYGGSPSWKKVRDQTEQWLNSGGGGGGDGDPAPPPVPPVLPPGVPGEPPPAVPRTSISPELRGLIASLAAALGSSGGGSGGGGGGGAGGGGGGSPGGGPGRSASRASAVGGRALGGAYGARTGAAGPLAEIGLNLADLTGLSQYQQAKRILDAALGPRGDVMDSELRKTNSVVVLWAIQEEIPPTPVEMANRWVVEYVWQAWITEDGEKLLEVGVDRARREQEMRVALEATVSAHALPEDRTLTGADFTEAIESALGSLRRIAGGSAA